MQHVHSVVVTCMLIPQCVPEDCKRQEVYSAMCKILWNVLLIFRSRQQIYDYFMITIENLSDTYIVCTVLFQSAVCSASVSHDFPLLLIRVVRRILFVINP